MPRQAKGPRLYAYRRAGREPVWIIRDGANRVGTGCAIDDRRGADLSLARYLAEKYEPRSQGGLTTVADVLMLYAREHAATKASAQLIGYHLKALGPFWGGKLLSDVGAKACRDYVKHRSDRVKPATARRELETLNAAIRYCAREHKTPLALLSFPERGEARDRWLTRSEAARLLLAAWRAGNHHLARFILIGLYSGTRHGAILRLQWHANTAGGWFDIEYGVMHRAGSGTAADEEAQASSRPCVFNGASSRDGSSAGDGSMASKPCMSCTGTVRRSRRNGEPGIARSRTQVLVPMSRLIRFVIRARPG